jgi:hypothetical protein
LDLVTHALDDFDVGAVPFAIGGCQRSVGVRFPDDLVRVAADLTDAPDQLHHRSLHSKALRLVQNPAAAFWRDLQIIGRIFAKP